MYKLISYTHTVIGIQYPEEANPILPPSVRLVTGSSERYVIDITDSVPTSTRRLGYSTLVVRVEDLSQPCVPVYFVLVSNNTIIVKPIKKHVISMMNVSALITYLLVISNS